MVRSRGVVRLAILCIALWWQQGTVAQDLSIQLPLFVDEIDGIAQACVQLTGPVSDDSYTVVVSTVDGSARASEDYTGINESLIFTPTSDTRMCVDIEIIQNGIVEPIETFDVMAISTNTSTSGSILIFDTDIIEVGFQQTLYTISESSSTPLMFCAVVVSGEVAMGANVQIIFNAGDQGTASAFDYIPIRITKTLESASTDPMCASFPIQNDDIIEETENFFITLTGVGSVNVVTGSATVLILDDDGATVELESAILELNEGSGGMNATIDFCIALTDTMEGLERAVVLNLTTVDGTATGSQDFEALTETLVIPSSTVQGSRVCHPLAIIGDDVVEMNETFTILLVVDSLQDVVAGPSTASVTILDDDVVPVSLDIPSSVLTEADGGAEVCALIETVIERNVVVFIRTQPVTAEDGEDFIVTSPELTFEPGAPAFQRQCTTVSVVEDGVPEGDEVVNVLLGTEDPSVQIVETFGSIVIENDDAILSLTDASYTISEGEMLSVCVLLTGDLKRNVVGNIFTQDGTASGGVDFTPVSVELLFERPEVMCINISVLDDIFFEGAECLTVILEETDGNVTLNTSSAQVVIEDRTVIADDTVDVILSQLSAIALSNQTAENLATIAQLFVQLENLATNGNITIDDQAFRNITQVMNTLMEWPQDIIQQQSARIVENYEQLAGILVQQEDFQHLLVTTDNIIFLGEQVPIDDDGITFSPYAVARKRREIPDDSPDSIMLPRSLFESLSNASVFFTFYETPIFFPLAEGSREDIVVGTSVIAATVAGNDIMNLQENVTILLQLENPTPEVQCVSWNETVAGGGDWTSSGCTTNSITSNGTVTCSCDHLTNFAVLVGNESLACDQITNMFVCECRPGFILDEDAISCLDVNECASLRPCDSNAVCNNTIGSFQCTCLDGFSGDGLNCTDVNECASLQPCDSNAVCTNTIGSFQCTCRDGYSGDGLSCTAIDCGVLRNPVNGRVQLPRTVVGSQAVYSCDMGFVLIGDDTRTCGLDGQWSGSQPSCDPSEPTVETGAARERDSGTIGIAVGVAVGGTLLFVTVIIIIIAICRKRNQRQFRPNSHIAGNPNTGEVAHPVQNDHDEVLEYVDNPVYPGHTGTYYVNAGASEGIATEDAGIDNSTEGTEKVVASQ